MKLSGVLFFPATPFDPRGEVDPSVLREHITTGLAHGPGGVFAACGTGELTSLSEREQALVVRTAVEAASGEVPVFAGAGGPLGTALHHARAAAEAGADGLLLLPPVARGAVDGLSAYVAAVAEVGLPVVLYQRAPLVLESSTVVELAGIPGVVGFKDGLGDMDRMQRIVLAVRAALGEREFTFFNGLPTAELTQPAYRAIGVDLYSSAAFSFVPEVATAFARALPAGTPVATELLTRFYAPLAELRSRVPGYAVSLVKAGLRLRGVAAGPVRAPLTEPSPEHLAELSRIVDAGLGVVRDAA
ncbi:5-dehydro-4-deoxyglucarate dehydratase [Streptomyces sp. GSL17-111]|uniref:5-dehydro-4-deoxyglucarate dehydratase n=1 Tax=Streptomyces sp. GSL17-111 TaxID=3121596 RepID=UPI0030F454CF